METSFTSMLVYFSFSLFPFSFLFFPSSSSFFFNIMVWFDFINTIITLLGRSYLILKLVLKLKLFSRLTLQRPLLSWFLKLVPTIIFVHRWMHVLVWLTWYQLKIFWWLMQYDSIKGVFSWMEVRKWRILLFVLIKVAFESGGVTFATYIGERILDFWK